MAGIGFELKKLFKRKGVLALIQAYGYTGMVTAGPMLLGIFFLLGITYMGKSFGLGVYQQDLLVIMITYGLLASLLLTGFFSMVVTRYVSDMLYEEKDDRVLPSLEGVLSIALPVGGVIYGVFLLFSGIKPILILLNLVFFLEMVVVWTEMNYLTAIKDYKGIMLSYIGSIAVSLLMALAGCMIRTPNAAYLLSCVCVGYGIMMCAGYKLLCGYFTDKGGHYYDFLKWFDRYKSLAVIGVCTNVGLFSHLVIAWMSDIGEQIEGLFYGAPQHDISAMFAFLTVLVTTINFVASVEVNFYPRYRRYYGLFNGQGALKDIEDAGAEMLTVLDHELSYTARRQLYMTLISISLGVVLLERLPLGFNDMMEGYFRILCVGYGAYAVANVIMLILMYFMDYKGAATAAVIFAVCTTSGCIFSLFVDARYYGFAFAAGAAVYYIYSWFRLRRYTANLPYHILSTQPVVVEERTGIGAKMCGVLNSMFVR